MLDKILSAHLKGVFNKIARPLVLVKISANTITFVGFTIGMLAVLALAFQSYLVALALILLSRLCDALDGAVARQTQISDFGAFLDVSLDFIFYSAIPLGFALANPTKNALAAAILIFSFVGSGSAFLSFAIIAEKRALNCQNYPNKGFYYLSGLTEASETIICFVFMCLWSDYFVWFAIIFAAMCALTTICRLVFAWVNLKSETLKIL